MINNKPCLLTVRPALMAGDPNSRELTLFTECLGTSLTHFWFSQQKPFLSFFTIPPFATVNLSLSLSLSLSRSLSLSLSLSLSNRKRWTLFSSFIPFFFYSSRTLLFFMSCYFSKRRGTLLENLQCSHSGFGRHACRR